jgi:hypothetical protein
MSVTRISSGVLMMSLLVLFASSRAIAGEGSATAKQPGTGDGVAVEVTFLKERGDASRSLSAGPAAWTWWPAGGESKGEG